LHLIFLIIWILIFFGDKQKADAVLWQEGPNQYFKYADQDTSSFGENDHPVELDQGAINTALKLLKFDKKKSSDSVALASVFSDEQVGLLSRIIASGLKSANPNKDIIFVIERVEQKLLGLKKDSSFVAGRVFFKDGQLNLILGDYDRVRNRGYEVAYDPTSAGIVSYSFNHGNRTKQTVGSTAFNQVIVQTPGIENKKLKNIRRNWFVIDLGVAPKHFADREEEEKKMEMAKKRKEIEEILGRPIPVAVAPQTVPVRTTEYRLNALNNLKEKGLVTEEEYIQKRKEILEDL